MLDLGKERKKKKEKKKLNKFLVFLLIIIFLFLVFLIYFFILKSSGVGCGDGTLEGVCSLRKPYFCSNGKLVEKASLCECGDDTNLSVKGESCISEYQTEPKEITLKYILRRKEDSINLMVYNGLVEHLSTLPASIYYQKGEKPSRQDFKLRNIDNKEQRQLLLPLVTEIQNIAKDKTDQVRIAISIVQKIPFGNSEKKNKRLMGRLIGEKGRMRNAIEQYSNVFMSIYPENKIIGLIGDYESLKIARKAVNMLLDGLPHYVVLNFLLKKSRERKEQEFQENWKPSFN